MPSVTGIVQRVAAAADQGAGAAVRTFTDHGVTRPLVAPAYLHPIGTELDSLLRLGDRFPGLARVEVIGHSVEGRPMVAIHLTNFADGRAKPLVGLESGIHGDEAANAPMLHRELVGLLERYPTDPEARAILDSREIRAVLYANPDGRARVEAGFVTGLESDLFHRANAHGVDENRNFPDDWGETVARRGSAGPFPLSEPETQALAAYWRAHPPNFFVAAHSAGERVLLPEDPSDGLVAAAEAIASRNGYRVESSDAFTPGGVSGTSKDWVNRELRSPAITLETGRTHLQSDREFAETVRRNRPALDWILRAADDIEARALGPQVMSAARDQASRGVQVLAAPDGRLAAVAGVELYSDPLAAVGTGVRLVRAPAAASDVRGAGASVWRLPPAAGADGVDSGRLGAGLLYARAVDTAGNWGPFRAVHDAG